MVYPLLGNLTSVVAILAKQDTSIGAKLFVEGTAQQLVNGLVIVFSGDVPEGDINATDGSRSE